MNIIKDSIFAGLILSIAGFASIKTPTPINGIVFSFGLFLIISLRLSLFTGNVLKAENGITKNYIIECIKSYIGNFIGCFIFAYLLTLSCNTDIVLEIAEYKASLLFLPAIIKGILCNILVCIAVFLSRRCEESINKFICIVIPITLFILCGFEHSIANMSFFIIAKSNMFNLIPVTIGNIIGGLVVVFMTRKFKSV